LGIYVMKRLKPGQKDHTKSMSWGHSTDRVMRGHKKVKKKAHQMMRCDRMEKPGVEPGTFST